MDKKKLESIASQMVSKSKGILAIDESSGTANKRFEALVVEPTEENRRLYRQMLVTAPGIEQYVSGYIFYDETLRQKTDGGALFPDFLEKKGVMPGIKVDMGKEADPNSSQETVTIGLDGLEARLKEYVQLGAMFTKWRAVIKIGDGLPTDGNIIEECSRLAQYAAKAQAAGLVPMVEPEVLLDGDHSIETCYKVTIKTLKTLFEQLDKLHVYLPGLILKTSMVISGKDAEHRASIQEVAEQTLKALKESVPTSIGGIVFLSGGQSAEDASAHLNAMHQLDTNLPWPLSFSYARAIQQPALEIWAANMSDVPQAQAALVYRAKMNSLAVKGEYSDELEDKKPY